ncbi:MAG TPA: homoserine dehydrogenase [Candidatus Kapabacteria bacterium]|nr:homoserine dehydrogenase [Candidatus Kapabacteria bacterium]
MANKIRLGIFGFGVVGQGLYYVLSQTNGISAEISKICIKNPEKDRILDRSLFTTDRFEILNDPDVDVIVELIDDHEAAYEIVKYALQNGKHVVTANKRMLADNLEELYQLQKEYKTHLLYEGACCASIPIIRNLEEYYDNDLLNAVEGIFNGSTNYILTKMAEEGVTYTEALNQAQEKGFAEADPTLDVAGFDSKFKLSVILAHSFGIFNKPESILNFGINKLSEFDFQFAKQRGFKIKLKANCRKDNGKVFSIVAPQFLAPDDKLYPVNNEYNGVIVEGAFSENQYFIGKGAGSYPTGSAVLSDISALTFNYKYEYKKYQQNLNLELSNDFKLKLYVRWENEGIDKELFDEIDEEFRTTDNSYIIGSINLANLQQSKWLERDDISIILTNKSELLSA